VSRADSRVVVFVDYDGTITDRDTLDVLVQRAAGDDAWLAIERRLMAGGLSLREALALQASLVRCSLDEADELLRSATAVDPTFAAFETACRASGIPLRIVSSGVEPLIRRSLARNGLAHIELVANDVDPHPAGWRLRFRDQSANGTDKRALVERAQRDGNAVVYIGDGISDYDASIAADVRFAKVGRSLHRHLTERRVPFVAFERFADIDLTTLRAA
jgi:2,3-diketo-5-methylthio-1-phosphopentane phosphatase